MISVGQNNCNLCGLWRINPSVGSPPPLSAACCRNRTPADGLASPWQTGPVDFPRFWSPACPNRRRRRKRWPAEPRTPRRAALKERLAHQDSKSCFRGDGEHTAARLSCKWGRWNELRLINTRSKQQSSVRSKKKVSVHEDKPAVWKQTLQLLSD